jgi:hypothetical protein
MEQDKNIKPCAGILPVGAFNLENPFKLIKTHCLKIQFKTAYFPNKYLIQKNPALSKLAKITIDCFLFKEI